MKITIVGVDWETCYLHDMPERKKQVLDDLKIKVEKDLIVPCEIIEIDVADHSSATEMFQVEDIRITENSVILSYAGGVS